MRTAVIVLQVTIITLHINDCTISTSLSTPFSLIQTVASHAFTSLIDQNEMLDNTAEDTNRFVQNIPCSCHTAIDIRA